MAASEKTFRERYMAGETDFDEIFDLTEKWGFSDETCTLREYLGLTEQEEDIWVTTSDEDLEDFMEKEKTRWVFFTDLDGTLLDDDKNISDENRAEIERILADGHAVVLCTGRALPSAIQQAKRLGLLGRSCYLICYNGAQIYDAERRCLIYKTGIPLTTVRKVFDDAHNHGINVQTYSEQGVLAEKDSSSLQKYLVLQSLTAKIVPDVCKTLKEDPPKILALDFDSHDNVESFREYMTQAYDGELDCYLSNPYYLEIVPLGINKGNAVRFLCGHLGIPISRSLAAGDAENDLSMILAAGTGAVMANGEPLLKENADYITTADNNHSGVSEILRKFIP